MRYARHALAVVNRCTQWRRHPVNNDGQAASRTEQRKRSPESAWLELATWHCECGGIGNMTTGTSSWTANCCRTAVWPRPVVQTVDTGS